ncbi:MAG: hypothetical protein LBQ24_05680 [Candidatus Peribacteria bacterium]|nr:hypothetical protein [Candidatus Peribacteria bacterium]
MSSTSVNPHPSPLPKGEGIEWNFSLKPHPFAPLSGGVSFQMFLFITFEFSLS